MASGAFSADPARRPAEVKPVMSDPARPEMARGAIRGLPVDYTQVATSRLAEPDPVQPPRLGPPLPGDIAAFAPDDRRRPPDTPGATQRVGEDGSSQGDSSTHHPAPDPGEAEERDAQKAGLFFALREPPQREGPATQSPTPQPTSSPLSAFLPQARDTPPETGRERMLFPGAVIAASLITEVNSESAGPVIAQVTQAVHDSATGRILLIPQGARLIGDYQSSTRYGQSRVAIVWSRLIMPDGDEVKLDEAAVDPSGAAGVSGQVDNHWTDVFGAAALGTLISIGVATTEEPQLTYGGLGVTTRDPVDAAIADGIQRSASTVTNRVVDRGLARPPTIRVAAGAKVAVIVTRRMAF
jgi:type IV secretion system protein VirB10